MKAHFLAIAAMPLLAACATTGQIAAEPAAQEEVSEAPSVLTTSVAASTWGPENAPVTGSALVSAADPRAAEAGAQILRQGGSATDAAIATMLALTVVEPQSSGIGGGGFFVRGDKDGNVSTLDGREKAPAAAGPDWFLDEQGERRGYRDVVLTGLSIGVPGNVRLAGEAHQRFGKLEWSALFQPAIRLARDGFKVSPRFHGYLGRFKQRAGASPDGLALFYDAQGEPLAEGATFRNPALAATLEAIAEAGPDQFYNAQNAKALAGLIAGVTPYDEAMTGADVESYAVAERPAVCATYREHRVCGMGPPSSGATTIIAMLKQMERFDLGAMGPDSPQFWHVFAESQRLAYADRERYLADADFVPVPVAWLTDADYLAGRGQLINPDARTENVAAGIAPQASIAPPDGDEPPENGTSHFVAVDNAGNAVSYTSTIEGPFGSGQVFGGFYLNNELTDFSFTPEADGRAIANRVEGSKRPRSSMAPTLVYGPDDQLLYAVGAAGGSTIPVQVTKTLIGMIDFGLDLDSALALPMMFSPGDRMTLEEGTSLEAMMPALQALGHTEIGTRRLPTKTNAAMRTADGWVGAGDPRSEGVAVSQ